MTELTTLDTPEEATQRLFRQLSEPSETLDILTEEAGGDRVEAIARITHIVASGFSRDFPPDEYHRRWYEHVESRRSSVISVAREVDPEAKISTILQQPNVQILSGIARGLYRAMLEARRGPWPWPVSVRPR